jgi:hypothetical protein
VKTLDVIFRFDEKGLGFKYADPVTAVFPSQRGTHNTDTAMSYAHIGQHGVCSRDWYTGCTRAATPEEYAPLLAELRRIYETGPDAVKLRVVKRWTARHDRERMEALQK